MPTIRAGKWHLVIIPGDHDPRHVHVTLGSKTGPQVVVLLCDDGIVRVRKIRKLSKAEAREGIAAAHEHFDELLELWEKFC